MPRPRAPHGTYAAYRRHLREKTAVCEPCRIAQQRRDQDRNAKTPESPPAGVTFDVPMGEPPAADAERIVRLRWNLALVESALPYAALKDLGRLAALSKQHAALLEEIDAIEKHDEPTRDALDDFLTPPNVVGISTAAARKQA